MESEWVLVVDTRKTYVSQTTDERLELIILLNKSQSGGRQKHASVCDVLIALFENVYNAHQIRTNTGSRAYAYGRIGHDGVLLL